jgi:hydroxypyruvate isomerase
MGDRGMTRREMLAASAGAVVLGAMPSARATAAPGQHAASGAQLVSSLKQSVSYWPFESIPLPQFSRELKTIGFSAVDLLQPEQWSVVAEAGLVCSMGYPSERQDFLTTGFNDPANHAMLLAELEATLPRAAAAGVPNVIAMFGNRHGRADDAGRDACIEGLNRIKALAEDTGVTVCVELLNSRVDHADYMGDRSAYGVSVVSAVNSPRIKLLYDIYHMQIMEGDIIHTIRDSTPWLGHFHTGGVPGRHEIDGTQELNYRAICEAIKETGYEGYVAHEFEPTRPPMESLRQAYEICAV